jgi:hypothetical protein
MKTIQITQGAHLIQGVHRTDKDGPISVPDTIADDLIRIGHAEVVGSTVLVHRGFDPGQYADAYTPARPDDDPTHAARALGLKVEEGSGLVALAKAGHPHAKVRGRYGPDPVTDLTAPASQVVPVVSNPPEKPKTTPVETKVEAK